MKCPNCYHIMEYRHGSGANCYFRCPACGYTIGETEEDKKKEEEKKEEQK